MLTGYQKYGKQTPANNVGIDKEPFGDPRTNAGRTIERGFSEWGSGFLLLPEGQKGQRQGRHGQQQQGGSGSPREEGFG